MRVFRRIKVIGLMIAALGILMTAAPAYSWTHYGHRPYHRPYYGHHYYRPYYGVYYGSYYRPYYYPPSVAFAFPFYVPGVSIYVGP